jgi:hypothetical protein
MLDMVDLFREKETRDELGLASVRDSFADQLFPGTSTIQTRARYFLLVAWTYQALEAKRIGSTPISERARRAETALIEAIERSDDKEGNIGKYARSALKRLPSSVYWQGLGVWGIRAFQGSLAQYHRSFERHHNRREHHLARKSERDEEHDDLLTPNWHGGLPKRPDGFPEACSLRLSSEDADCCGETSNTTWDIFGGALAVFYGQHMVPRGKPDFHNSLIKKVPRLGFEPRTN